MPFIRLNSKEKRWTLWNFTTSFYSFQKFAQNNQGRILWYLVTNCSEWTEALNYVQQTIDAILMVDAECVDSFRAQRTELLNLISKASLKSNIFRLALYGKGLKN